jgi:hydroxymethylpyrimidine/phosphomethylpyrimidine kinase
MAAMTAVALTIAGSDPSGGAGLQADLKTFHQLGAYGMSVVTLITVQNTCAVSAVRCLEPALVRAQLDAVLADIPPRAIKTGALGSAEVVREVAHRLRRVEAKVVVDPVMISKHGAPLLDVEGCEAIRESLLPSADLVTPNADEAAALTGLVVRDVEGARCAARALVRMGARAALVKGGHLALEDEAVDVLCDGDDVIELRAPRIRTRAGHGTGCTYAAAIAALLAQGLGLGDATRQAKAWLTEALAHAPSLGHGVGPLEHRWPFPAAR